MTGTRIQTKIFFRVGYTVYQNVYLTIVRSPEDPTPGFPTSFWNDPTTLGVLVFTIYFRLDRLSIFITRFTGIVREDR